MDRAQIVKSDGRPVNSGYGLPSRRQIGLYPRLIVHTGAIPSMGDRKVPESVIGMSQNMHPAATERENRRFDLPYSML